MPARFAFCLKPDGADSRTASHDGRVTTAQRLDELWLPDGELCALDEVREVRLEEREVSLSLSVGVVSRRGSGQVAGEFL